MTNNHAPRVWLVGIGLAVAVIGACATGPSPTGGPPTGVEQVDSKVDVSIRASVLDENVGAIVKLQPDGFDSIRPFIERFGDLPATNGADESDPDTAATPGEELLGYLETAFGGRFPVDGVEPDRPIWVTFEPRLDHPRQICQDVSLPCEFMGGPMPRFIRVLVPSEAPERVAGQIDEGLVSGSARARPLGAGDGDDGGPTDAAGGWVRVEIGVGTGIGPDFDWSKWLDKRFEQTPEGAGVGALTPAKAAVLEADGLGAFWADLGAFVDYSEWRERQFAVLSMAGAAPADQFRLMGQSVIRANSPAALGVASEAELDDIGWILSGDGNGDLYVDAVTSRTARGQKVYEAAGGEVELSVPTFDSPGFELEFAYDVAASGEAAEGGGLSRGELIEEIRHFGLQDYVTLFQSPAAFIEAFSTASNGTNQAPDLRALRLAGNFQAGGAGFPVEVGLTMVVGAGASTDTLAGALERLAASVRWLQVDKHPRGADRVEYRVAVGRSMDELYPKNAETAEVGELELDLRGHTVVALLKKASREVGAVGWQLRMLMNRFSVGSALSDMTIAVRGGSSEDVATMRLTVGSGGPVEPEVEAYGLSPRESKERCLVRAGQGVREMLEEAVAAQEFEKSLLDALESGRHDFTESVEACADRGETAGKQVEWALGAYDGIQAVLHYRIGNRDTAKRRLKQACARGLEWSCDTSFLGTAPWKSLEDDHAPTETSDSEKTGGEMSEAVDR